MVPVFSRQKEWQTRETAAIQVLWLRQTVCRRAASRQWGHNNRLYRLTLRQLSDKYSLSVRTIWERLKGRRHVHVISKYRNVVINMDTTYWGRHFGLMIIKDTFRNKILWHRFVRDESVSGYLDGIEWLRANGSGYTALSARACVVCFRHWKHTGYRCASNIWSRLSEVTWRQNRIWKRPSSYWPSHNHSAGYRKRTSGRHSLHGMKNGGTSSRRKAPTLMAQN